MKQTCIYVVHIPIFSRLDQKWPCLKLTHSFIAYFEVVEFCTRTCMDPFHIWTHKLYMQWVGRRILPYLALGVWDGPQESGITILQLAWWGDIIYKGATMLHVHIPHNKLMLVLPLHYNSVILIIKKDSHVHSTLNVIFRATSHTSQEPWPWNCESPNKSIEKPSKLQTKGHPYLLSIHPNDNYQNKVSYDLYPSKYWWNIVMNDWKVDENHSLSDNTHKIVNL